MPLCTQLTITPVTVTSTGMTTSNTQGVYDLDTSSPAFTTVQSQVTTAQATADGKNRVYYSIAPPGSTANTAGDIWWQYSDGVIIGQWVGAGGTSWTSQTIGSAVIANLDAGKITAGTISAAISITSPSATFTAGKIGNFEVTSNDYLKYGSTYLYGNSGSGSYCLQDTSRGIYTKEIILSGTSSTTISASAGTINTLYTDTIGNSSMTLACTTMYGNSTLYGAGIAGRTVQMLGSSGSYQIACTTSTRRNKQDEAPMGWDPSALLTLPMKQFRLNSEVAHHGKDAPLHFGLMAEDVADAGLEWLIDRDEQGRPDYIYWSERMPQALLALVQQQAARIEQLETRLAALEGAN